MLKNSAVVVKCENGCVYCVLLCVVAYKQLKREAWQFVLSRAPWEREAPRYAAFHSSPRLSPHSTSALRSAAAPRSRHCSSDWSSWTHSLCRLSVAAARELLSLLSQPTLVCIAVPCDCSPVFLRQLSVTLSVLVSDFYPDSVPA